MFFKKYDNTGVLNIFSAVLFLSLFLTSIVLGQHSAIISFTFADSDKGQENKEKHDTNQSHQSDKGQENKENMIPIKIINQRKLIVIKNQETMVNSLRKDQIKVPQKMT